MADRAQLTTFFTKIYVRVRKIIATRFNLDALRKQFAASGDSIVQIVIYDEQMEYEVFRANFRLGSNEPEMLSANLKPDVIVKSDYITALDVLNGRTRIKTIDGVRTFPYDINEAFRDGRMTVIDNRSDKIYLNDLVLFQHLYAKIIPELRSEMGAKPVTVEK